MLDFLKKFVSTDNTINELVCFAIIVLLWLLTVYTLGLCKVMALMTDVELTLFIGLFTALCGIGTNRANKANALASKLTETLEDR